MPASLSTPMKESALELAPSRPDGPRQAVRISLMGASLDIGNRGVAALGASLVELILSAEPKAEITFLVGRRTSGNFTVRVQGRKCLLPVINFRLSPRAPLGQQLGWIVFLAALYRWVPLRWVRSRIANNPWIGAALQSDWIGDIRGGDSFSDIYGMRRLIVGTLPILAVYWLKGGIVLLPQTYGPYKSWLARQVARFIINRASVILSRDRASLDVITSLTSGKQCGEFCPDVAFVLDASPPEVPAIEPPLPPLGLQTLIGLNVNGLLFNGGYNRANMFGLKLDYRDFLLRLVTVLLADPQTHVLFVPHTFAPPQSVESDQTASENVRKLLPPPFQGRLHMVTKEYDQHEIKGVIGICDFFIGSRMHSCIAALSQNIPTVGVAYSKKFHGVFDSIGVSDWVIDGRALDSGEAIEKVLILFRQRQVLKVSLAAQVACAKRKLGETFALLLRASSQKTS